MRGSELLRLVGLNINQNKFKTIMTSIGIVVGAATIVLVIGIGRGGQMDVAEQFAELNAGAIDITYEYAGEEESSGGSSFLSGIGEMFGNIGNMIGGFFGGGGGGQSMGGGASDSVSSGSGSSGGGGGFSGGGMGGDFSASDFAGQMPDSFSGGDSGTDSTDGSSSSDGSSGGGSSRGSRGGNSPGSDSGENGMPGDSDTADNDASSDGEQSGTDRTDRPQAEDTDGENSGAADGETGEGADTADAADGEDTDAENAESEDSDEEETSAVADRLNQEEIILTQNDVEDIERYVSGITGATISYSTKASIEGANLTSAQTYTVAGVKENYADLSKLTLAEGDFLTEEDDDLKERVCVLGATTAEELFGDTEEIAGSTIYIEDRTYTVVGVLNQSSTVSSGISPDTAIFIPYETGIKYVTGESISPTLTVIAEDVNVLDSVISDVRTVLEENYDNAEFTFEDSGSKMEAAQSSNKTLTMLLSAMAAIVFLVGGIGIMNVLFVSVKERTNEIGILKAIGTSRTDILIEFLVESAAISCIGGILGVAISFGIIPVVERFDVRVEITTYACLMALGFAVLTGTVFGIYPAWKASRLEPVEALNAE